MYEKNYIRNPSTGACEIDTFLKTIVGDLIITCDEIVDTSENVSLSFNDKKTANKMDYYILHGKNENQN